MKAIVPVGGRGTRMRPVTFTANKHFIPVGNKPLIFYPLETIQSAGVKDVAITYNPGQLKLVKDFLGDDAGIGLNITYILQPEPIGLANIVEVCEEWVGKDKFFLHLGDNIFDDGIKEIVDHFGKSKNKGLVTMIKHPENHRMGVPYFDKKGKLVKYVEKPQNPPHSYAVPGLYFADHDFFKVFRGKSKIKPSARGEYEMPDAFQWLIDHGYHVEVKEYKGKWLDPGKFDDWIEANQYLLDKHVAGDIESETVNCKIEGRVNIGTNCVIKNSTIRGPVSIGNDCTIEDSFIGPYSSIFHKSHVNRCHIQNSVLMESVEVSGVDRPIDSSIIGPFAEVTKNNSSQNLELFLGELSRVVL